MVEISMVEISMRYNLNRILIMLMHLYLEKQLLEN